MINQAFQCTVCLGHFMLDRGLMPNHCNGAERCSGSQRMPGSVDSFFAVRVPERLTQPRPVPEGAGEVQAAINEAVSENFVAWRKSLDEELKDIVRRAMKLVEENPRNEPMRTEISRPAVERMLAEDLGAGSAEGCLGDLLRAEVAKELFDLGWRPTLDRVVR